MSRKKRLAETLAMVLVVEPNIDIVKDNMVAEWSSTPYPQLSVLLVYLRHLSFIHQNHHWVSKGEPFYGDHLLFQRLYAGVAEDIDTLAEKAIGLGSTANVALPLHTMQLNKLLHNMVTAKQLLCNLSQKQTNLPVNTVIKACTEKDCTCFLSGVKEMPLAAM